MLLNWHIFIHFIRESRLSVMKKLHLCVGANFNRLLDEFKLKPHATKSSIKNLVSSSFLKQLDQWLKIYHWSLILKIENRNAVKKVSVFFFVWKIMIVDDLMLRECLMMLVFIKRLVVYTATWNWINTFAISQVIRDLWEFRHDFLWSLPKWINNEWLNT